MRTRKLGSSAIHGSEIGGMRTGNYRRGEPPGAETRFADWKQLAAATLAAIDQVLGG